VADQTSWTRHLQSMVAGVMLLAILAAAILSSCAGDGNVEDTVTTESTASVADLPSSFSEVILIEEDIADGAVMAVVEMAQPDQIETASTPSLPKEDAHLHFEVQLRYTDQVLGGRVAGEFVPYLQVGLRIVNDTTGEVLETRLRPHVGVAEGWHYAANITLPGDSPTYTAQVTTTGPLPFDGTTPAESTNGTIVTHSDLTPNLPGTLLDFATPMQLTATIHLDDIIAARLDDDGETPPPGPDDDDDMEQPTPPPPVDPYAG
jgi:uncharacterized protein involved in high-affinity Fe2+ transport